MKKGKTMRARIIGLLWLLLLSHTGIAMAGQVEVVNTRFDWRAGSWHVSTTLKHDDTGWEHYADAWRVVSEQGEVLATRTLFHPHEDEQPFTRSLGNVSIPADVSVVYVEAHDKVDGWSKQRIRVDLRQAKGERYEIHR
jgi:hypothetical protein